jgi:adenosine deaminase
LADYAAVHRGSCPKPISVNRPAPDSVALLPKVHLHCHLEGTLREATFLELADRYGLPTRYHPDGNAAPPVNQDNPYAFATFEEFLYVFAAVSRVLRTPDDYARLAREFAQDALQHNVMYGELFISPSVWQFFVPELDLRDAVSAVRSGLDEVTRGTDAGFGLILDVTRNFGAGSALQTVQLAAQLGDLGVLGIGLGGDEVVYPPELFAEVFASARKGGLHAVAHAGETAGANSVRSAIEVLRAERIGHGVRSLEDRGVVDLLVRRGVPLEICPTSNFLTGAVSRTAPHPLLELDAAGAVITIDADDPALFQTSITNEYAYVASLAGTEALARFVANAIDASFADGAHKARMHARLRAASADMARGASNPVAKS